MPIDESTAPDDLTRIPGIGPKTEQAMHAAGIRTYAALASANPQTLLEALSNVRGISVDRIQSWIEQAQQLEAGA
ncbi:MAG: helix-hairpin-helix domain-containing protein [Anaerolineae bacterium]|nr:helix-hairpin-helix domain-containing protein [Anaerolineae bacterium]